MTLGKKIRSLRSTRRMTMKEIAAELQVSPSTYRDWEYGRKIPAAILPKLARVFGTTVVELMEEQANSKPEAIQRTILYLEEGIRLLKSF